MLNKIDANINYAKVSERNEIVETLKKRNFLLWMVGCATILLFFTVDHRTCTRLVQEAKELEEVVEAHLKKNQMINSQAPERNLGMAYAGVKWGNCDNSKFCRPLTANESEQVKHTTGQSYNTISSNKSYVLPGFISSQRVRTMFSENRIGILFTGNSLMRRQSEMVGCIGNKAKFADDWYHGQDIKEIARWNQSAIAYGWRTREYHYDILNWTSQFQQKYKYFPKYITFGGWLWPILTKNEYFLPQPNSNVTTLIMNILRLIDEPRFQGTTFIWRLQPRAFDFTRYCEIDGHEKNACSGEHLTKGIKRFNEYLTSIVKEFNHSRVYLQDDFNCSLNLKPKPRDKAHFQPQGVYLMTQNFLNLLFKLEDK